MSSEVRIVSLAIERIEEREEEELGELDLNYDQLWSLSKDWVDANRSRIKWEESFYDDLLILSYKGFEGFIEIRTPDFEFSRIKLDGKGNISEYLGEVVYDDKTYKELNIDSVITNRI